MIRLGRAFEDGLLVILLGGMILLAFWQILQRNLFGSGMVWADELLRLLVLWLGLLGALVASRDDKHINIDLLLRFIPHRFKLFVCPLLHLATVVICSLLAWHSGRFVLMEIEFSSKVLGNLPAWPFEIVLPAGFGLIAFRYLIHFSRGVKSLVAGEVEM